MADQASNKELLRSTIDKQTLFAPSESGTAKGHNGAPRLDKFNRLLLFMELTYTQRYRSGHNGADSKSVCEQSHEGSNPSLCAKNRLVKTSRFSFSSAFLFIASRYSRMSIHVSTIRHGDILCISYRIFSPYTRKAQQLR